MSPRDWLIRRLGLDPDRRVELARRQQREAEARADRLAERLADANRRANIARVQKDEARAQAAAATEAGDHYGALAERRGAVMDRVAEVLADTRLTDRDANERARQVLMEGQTAGGDRG